MGRLTKQQERALFIAEFVRRLRGAAPGERVYMRVGDVFKDADVIDLKAWDRHGANSRARHQSMLGGCPLCPQKRTSTERIAMSALCNSDQMHIAAKG